MLIVEGSDNLGKTTICHRLVDLANELDPPKNPWDNNAYNYTHMTRPKEGFNFFTDYFPLMNVYGIQDRFHLSAIAYHDPVPFDQAKLRFIESWLYRFGSLIVIVEPQSSVFYEKRLSKSDKIEMFGTKTMCKARDIFSIIIDFEDVDGLFPIYDWSIYVELNEEGEIVKTATNEELKDILRQWFKRIELIKEVMAFETDFKF